MAARNAERAAVHDCDGAFPHASYTDLHDSGYLRLVIPATCGMGANVHEVVRAQEHLARGDGATALAAGMLVQLIGRIAEDGGWPESVFAAICQEIAAEGGLINSVYLGIGQAACDAACAYANNRRPPALNGPIADLPPDSSLRNTLHTLRMARMRG